LGEVAFGRNDGVSARQRGPWRERIWSKCALLRDFLRENTPARAAVTSGLAHQMSDLTRHTSGLAEQIFGRADRTGGILRQLARFTVATFGPARDFFARAAVTIEIAHVRKAPGDARRLPDNARILPECARILPDNNRILPDSARILLEGARIALELVRKPPARVRVGRDRVVLRR
jgi:hypothetical protein